MTQASDTIPCPAPVQSFVRETLTALHGFLKTCQWDRALNQVLELLHVEDEVELIGELDVDFYAQWGEDTGRPMTEALAYCLYQLNDVIRRNMRAALKQELVPLDTPMANDASFDVFKEAQ